MPHQQLPAVGLVWAQFAAYHVDRLEAVGQRLAGRAEVLAVEVAARSRVYAWEPSRAVAATRKVRLFAQQEFEDIAPLRRWWAAFRLLRRCDTVFVGLPYGEPDALLLAWTLRACGVRVVMMTASKWDDRPRRIAKELGKALLLGAFGAALVGGARQRAYVRFLGFVRRPVLCGYNTVSVLRVQAQAAAGNAALPPPSFAERPFVFVGRFVAKKQLDLLLTAYAGYACRAGAGAHRLEMIGSGEQEPQLRRQAEQLGIAALIDWAGFLDAPEVAARLARGLALILISREEQWGLAINEALAVGLPVIASAQVGAREALVGNLDNGWVVEPGSLDGLVAALAAIAADEAGWSAMSQAAHRRAWLGDSERFADAVEILCFPGDCAAARDRHERFEAAILPPPGGDPL